MVRFRNILYVWDKIKNKDKNYLRSNSYFDFLLVFLSSMFTFEPNKQYLKKPCNIALELDTRIHGLVGFVYDKADKIIKFGKAHHDKTVNWYGETDYYNIITADGKTFKHLKDGVDCVIYRNNKLGHSDLMVQRFAGHLADIDGSQVDLLTNARFHPIISAKAEKTAKIIKKALEDKKDGIPVTITNEDAIADDLLGGSANNSTKSIEVINISDPNTATLFQYYSHYYNDVMERVYRMYGLSTMNTGKMAQTNNLEVSGSLASSLSYPIENYDMRLMANEELKRVFELDLGIKWGAPWETQMAKLEAIDGIDNIDEVGGINNEDREFITSVVNKKAFLWNKYFC